LKLYLTPTTKKILHFIGIVIWSFVTFEYPNFAYRPHELIILRSTNLGIYSTVKSREKNITNI